MADEELTPTQIYFVLGSRNPSDEDLNKVKDFLEKEAGKDDSPWKDGISNEFMALTYPKYNSSVELGKLSSYECDNITSVIKNLQTIGATETLKHFLNDNNSPNGHSAVTYLALHAMVAQNKIDSGKLDDTDKDAMEFFMNEQLKTLQTLADLTDEHGEHIVNFASLASNNRNLKDMAQIYNASIARRYEANGQPILQPARNLDQFFARVDADEQKYQTNIGGNEEARPQQTAPQEEQLPENVANVGKETKKDKNPSRPPKEYKSRDIKPKDVIDFFYEDIFLHYLNLWTDKLIGYIRNGVDRYADWCKQSGDDLDRAAEKMKNANCKAGAKKIAALFTQTAPQMDASYEAKMNRLQAINQATKENIHRFPEEPDKWTWKDSAGNDILSPQVDAGGNMNDDAKIVKLIKDEYARNPDRLKNAVEHRNEKDIEIEKSLHKLAVRNVMTKQAMKYMLDNNQNWVNAENPDFEKLVAAEMSEMHAAVLTIGAVVDDHAQAKGMSEADKKILYIQAVENFIDLQIEQQTKTFVAITNDAKNERFAFNNPQLLNMETPKEIKVAENMQRSLGALSQLYQDESGHTLKEVAEQYNRGLSGAAPLNVVLQQINQRQQNIDMSLEANHGRLSRLEHGSEDEQAAKNLLQSILGGRSL